VQNSDKVKKVLSQMEREHVIPFAVGVGMNGVHVLGAKLRKFILQMEQEHVIPFVVGAGTRCVYLEPTQVCNGCVYLEQS
jgi:hypothetical protein